MAGATLLLALTFVACSSAGDDAGDGETTSDGEASGGGAGGDVEISEEATTTTVGPDGPSAADPGQVVPSLENLLASYDAAVNEIVADPSIAGDAGDRTVQEFLRLFPAGSEFASGSLQGWVSQADEGISLRPASPDRGVNTTSLEGPPSRIDDDTILFGHCTVQSYIVVNDGAPERREERKVLPGTGRAVRVDGRWRLQEITTPPDARGCLTQGSAGGGPR